MSSELTTAQDNRTLYLICDDLQTHFETLELVRLQLAEPLPDDERADLEKARGELEAKLNEIGAQLATKTDAVAAVLRRIAAEQKFIKEEEARLHARRESFERAEDWLRAYVLNVMQKSGLKQLNTPMNTLYIRPSDGVVIDDAEKVPALYKKAEVKLPLTLWYAMAQCYSGFGPDEADAELRDARVKAEPSLSAIKKQLKAGETIPGADLEFRDNLILR